MAEVREEMVDMEEGTVSLVIGSCGWMSPREQRGQEKKSHNFKNCYSIILMVIVDVWASFPGNSHDSLVFQTASFYDSMGNSNEILFTGSRNTTCYPCRFYISVAVFDDQAFHCLISSNLLPL